MGKSGVGKSAESAEKADERPEWLPDGWNIEVRTRKSGPAGGTAYKCYIDPLNIHKFYSKPEVLRHLQTTKDSNCSSKKKKGTSKQTPSKEEEKCTDKHSPNKEKEKCIDKHSPNIITKTAEKANERPEWLPDGWDIKVQTRKSGPAMGSSYKCYIDPLNIYKFYSKPEVLRHLETSKDSNCSSKKKKGTSKHSSSKEEEKCTNKHVPNKEEEKCIDKHSPKKEKQKRTKSNQHSPSIEEEKCINMHSPSKGEEEDINMDSRSKDGEKFTSTHSPSNVAGEKSTEEDLPPGWIKEVKIRKNRNGIRKDWLYIDPVSGYVFHSKKDVLRYLESGDIDKCAIKPSRRQDQDEDNLTPSPAAKRQKPKQSTPRQKTSVAKEPESLELPDVNNSMKGQDADVPSGMMVATDTSGGSLKVSHRSSRRLARVEPVNLADNMINDQTPIVPKRNLRKNRTTLAVDMENKSSQHFNGVPEIEQPKAMNMRTTLSEDNKPEFLTNSNKFSKKKEPHIPRRASKRLAGSESKRSKEVIAELQQSDGGPDHTPLNGESQNKRRKSPKVLPDADNQLEKLEVDDDKSEPPLSFAFHYSWSDPSLDYAINTLTGVLPPVDNSVDNGPSTVPETDIQKPTIDTVTERSRDSQNNSVDNEPTTVPETDIQKPTIVTVTGKSRDSQNNSVDNEPTTVLETDTQKTLIDNVTRRSKDSQSNLLDNVTNGRDKKAPVQSNKSKRKKEVEVPKRLSKRLAGIEPEANPSDKALEYSSKKSFKEEPTATVLLTNGASDHLHAGEEAKLTHHASDCLKTEVLGKSSRKSGKSDDDQTVRKEQQKEKAETENISDDRSKPELSLPFGESWSDPCLEFAFKTLTGALPVDSAALPVDSAAEIFKVPSPGVGDPPNTELYGGVTTSINGKTHDSSNQSLNKEERNMDDQSSKPLLGQPELRTSSTSGKNMDGESSELLLGQPELRTSSPGKNMDGESSELLLGQPELRTSSPGKNMDGESSELLLGQPELRTSSTSGKNMLEFTNGESHNHEGDIIRNLEPVLRTSSTSTTRESHSSEMIRNLFGEPLYVEAENTAQLLDHSRTNGYSQIQEEPLKKNDQVAEGEFGTPEQPPPFQTETLNHDNTELQFCDSFMNSWSDPCLEFAFKTLTGVIPVQENLGIQGDIQEPSNCHNGRDGESALPDFGSSSFSQSDFSFHFDTGMKSTPGQQSSVSSSFPSPSLQSCPGVDPQQQYSQFNNNYQRR